VHHADVIIAGAGPAGSTAALVLARRGFDVLLLDRASFPRPKLCGGLLTWKSMRLLERVHGCTADALIDDGVVDTVTQGYAVCHRGRPLTLGRFAYPFHLIRRTAFDSRLLDLARQAGTQVVQECEVAGCAPDGTLGTSRGQFRGRFVIGADGVNSVVRKCFGLPRERWAKNLAAAVELTVPRDASPRLTDRPELHAGVLPAGYGWVFPNRDGMVLGLCGLKRHSENFKDAFAEFLRVLGEGDPHGFIRRHPLQGHPIPYGNALENPVQGNVLLAGDAGGYADPLLGEGIFYALLTGWYVAEAVVDALDKGVHPGPAYRERIRRHVMPEMRGANRLRWLLYGLNKIDPRNLGRYFRLRGGALAEMVHGMRSYDWGRKKRWDF
jgi:geranylgeranyl reductase family protein